MSEMIKEYSPSITTEVYKCSRECNCKLIEQARANAIDECFEKIEQRLHDDTEISFDLPVEEVLGENVDINGFLMLANEIVQKYKGLIFSKLKQAKYQLMEQNNGSM